MIHALKQRETSNGSMGVRSPLFLFLSCQMAHQETQYGMSREPDHDGLFDAKLLALIVMLLILNVMLVRQVMGAMTAFALGCGFNQCL